MIWFLITYIVSIHIIAIYVILNKGNTKLKDNTSSDQKYTNILI